MAPPQRQQAAMAPPPQQQAAMAPPPQQQQRAMVPPPQRAPQPQPNRDPYYGKGVSGYHLTWGVIRDHCLIGNNGEESGLTFIYIGVM